MSLETNAYTRTEGVAQDVNPNLYDEQAERYLYEAEKLRPLAVDVSSFLLNRPGRSYTKFKGQEFEVSELSEGTDTPVSAIGFDKVTLTVNWYGDAKQMSKEEISEAFDFVVDDLSYGASGALAHNRDVQIMTELLNTSTDAIYPFSSGVARTSANISTSDLFQYEQITRASTLMMVSENQEADLQAVIIHPYQKEAIVNDDRFIDKTLYGGNVMSSGLIGEIAGAAIIVSNKVQSVVENTNVIVYQAIALGPRAFMYGQKVSPVFEFDDEYKRKRAVTFHYYESFGVKNFHENRIIPIKSAVGLTN